MRWFPLVALAACGSIAGPVPVTSLSFHLDAACPSPLALDFFDGDYILGRESVAAGDSVTFVVLAGERRVTVQIEGTPFGWTPVVTVLAGERLRVLLRC